MRRHLSTWTAFWKQLILKCTYIVCKNETQRRSIGRVTVFLQAAFTVTSLQRQYTIPPRMEYITVVIFGPEPQFA